MDEAERVAYGRLRLKPWEFDLYTIPEYVRACEGYFKEQEDNNRTLLEGLRVVAYSNGTSKAKTIQQFWPLPWDKSKTDKKTKEQIKAEQEALKKWQGRGS